MKFPLPFPFLLLLLCLSCAHTATAQTQQPSLDDRVNAALRAAGGTAPDSSAPASAAPQIFSTQGRPRARGLDISFQVPTWWIFYEQENTSAIQVFASHDGKYTIEMDTERMRSSPDIVVTEAEAAALLTPPAVLRRFPPEMAKHMHFTTEQKVLGGLPACQFMALVQPPKGGPGTSYMAGLVFIRHGILVVFTGLALEVPAEELQQRRQELQAAMDGIFNTLSVGSGPLPPAAPADPDTRHTFTTAGHPKAAGIDISLKYPLSWVAQESDSPEVMQRFQSPKPNVWIDLILGAEIPDPGPLSEERIIALLDPETLKTTVTEGKAGSSLAMIRSARPATLLNFAHYPPELGPGSESRVGSIYYFVHQKRLVKLRLTGSAQDKQEATTLSHEMPQLAGNTLDTMADSLIFSAATQPPLTIAGVSIPNLPVNFTGGPVSWPLVGLLGALIIAAPVVIHLRSRSSARADARASAEVEAQIEAMTRRGGHLAHPPASATVPATHAKARLAVVPLTTAQQAATAPARVPARAPAAATPPSLITLFQSGETFGPYPAHEIVSMWDAGQIAGNASYWREGLPDYRPLVQDIETLRG